MCGRAFIEIFFYEYHELLLERQQAILDSTLELTRVFLTFWILLFGYPSGMLSGMRWLALSDVRLLRLFMCGSWACMELCKVDWNVVLNHS